VELGWTRPQKLQIQKQKERQNALFAIINIPNESKKQFDIMTFLSRNVLVMFVLAALVSFSGAASNGQMMKVASRQSESRALQAAPGQTPGQPRQPVGRRRSPATTGAAAGAKSKGPKKSKAPKSKGPKGKGGSKGSKGPKKSKAPKSKGPGKGSKGSKGPKKTKSPKAASTKSKAPKKTKTPKSKGPKGKGGSKGPKKSKGPGGKGGSKGPKKSKGPGGKGGSKGPKSKGPKTSKGPGRVRALRQRR
jgi:hypothetical protein